MSSKPNTQKLRSAVILLVSAAVTFLAGCPGNPPIDPPDGPYAVNPDIREYLEDRYFFDVERWRDILDSPIFRPEEVGDDAGDYSFVRQMVPAVFGRKVRGYDELKSFVDLLRAIGGDRAQFMQILLRRESPYHREYVEYWSQVFATMVRVQRDGDKSMGMCIAESTPPRVNPALASAGNIASCIIGNDPTADCSGGDTFNLWDVIRSSIAHDNLSAIYRANLFPIVRFPIAGAEVTPHNEQDDIAETFLHVYTQKNLDCLGCHNTNGSVSGEFDINGNPSFWNRHHPVPGNFELAMFDTAAGRDRRQVNQIFRHNIASGSERPWGMSNCGMFSPAGSPDVDSRYTADAGPADPYFTVPLDATGSVWEVEDIFHRGYTTLQSTGLRRDRLLSGSATIPDPGCEDHCAAATAPQPITAPPPAALDMLIGTRCATCHGTGHSSGLDLSADWQNALASKPATGSYCTAFLYRAVPGRPDLSCLEHVIRSDIMPGTGVLDDDDKDLFTAWINSLDPLEGCSGDGTSMCATMLASNDNHAAFAYVTAMTTVNKVWEEVIGARLTIANYFPRNDKQRDILQSLTESVFIAEDWSLENLLIAIVASEHFNRRAPERTDQTSAYTLDTYLKPFEDNDPRRPPEAQDGWSPGDPMPTVDIGHAATHMNDEQGRSRHRNAMSDGIYRYGAESLLVSTHRSLGWPAPKVRPSSSYPDNRLRKGIGQFYSDVEPGFRDVGFQSLITWEAVHGVCDKPTSDPDWIDAVLDRFDAEPGVYTYRDLSETIRDWLIGNAQIGESVPVGEGDSELALLNVVFGGSASSFVMDDSITLSGSAARNTLDQQAREFCGLLIETPQFLLAGIADEELGPEPKLRECNGGLCTYRDICEALEGSVENALSGNLGCADDCVTYEPGGRVDLFPPFCPRGRCRGMPGGGRFPDPDCLEDPFRCIPEPPECDLGCALVDCCGGPLPPLERPDYFLGLADGGIAELVQDVMIVRYRSDKPVPLEQGATLGYGDWLVLPPGSQARIVTESGVFQTPPGGVPQADEDGWRFLVTRNQDRGRERLNKLAVRPAREWIDYSLNSPETARGVQTGKVLEFRMQKDDPARIRQAEEAMKEQYYKRDQK